MTSILSGICLSIQSSFNEHNLIIKFKITLDKEHSSAGATQRYLKNINKKRIRILLKIMPVV